MQLPRLQETISSDFVDMDLVVCIRSLGPLAVKLMDIYTTSEGLFVEALTEALTPLLQAFISATTNPNDKAHQYAINIY